MLRRSLGHCLPIVVVAISFAATTAWGKVIHSRAEALTLAFPEADRVEPQAFSLTDDQQQQTARLSTSPVETKRGNFYIGYKAEQILGYAFLDTRTVRTLPGTFLVVLSPTGSVQKVLVLAFHEPEDYLPPERWTQQFEEKTLGPDVQLHKGIHGIAGATLSSQAVTNAVRFSLALFHILLQERH
jgi:Na+-translocating ferredoxin:NAD+ oxidoreductase RnfG subunit